MFDLIVLGGGPAGYLAAERAGHAGKKVLLIEKRALGGVCLNEGCIPSKALLHCAKVFDYTKHAQDYGVHVSSSSLDHKKVVERKNKVVKMLVSGVGALMKANKVTVIEGEGVLIDSKTVAVNGEQYQGEHLLLCTGSLPVVPPIPGLKEGLEKGLVLTNREILDLEEIPKELAVIGGGVIGLEMASYFASAGSKVTVIEMLSQIGGQTDKEIAGLLQKSLEEKGVTFLLNAKVTAVQEAAVVYEQGGETKEVSCNKVLLSIGRRPHTNGIGLEAAGVYVEQGRIITDECGRTNIPNIFAAGDVNGRSMLAHTAYREAEVAVNTILGKKDRMRYHAIPAVIYTNPEVASVGETEESAKAKGFSVKVLKKSMMLSGRYVAENMMGSGICKIIVNEKNQTLLGVHLFGSYTSEMIYGAALMIETELRISDIQELVFPHPTVCEVIRETIF